MFLSQVAQALHLQLAWCVFTEEHKQADKSLELKHRSTQSEFQCILNQETMETNMICFSLNMEQSDLNTKQ